jgi:hypothetical protein
MVSLLPASLNKQPQAIAVIIFRELNGMSQYIVFADKNGKAVPVRYAMKTYGRVEA